MVLPRVLTAVVLVPVMIVIVWMGSLPFFIFVAGISLLSFWEYSLMAEEGGFPNQFVPGLLGSFIILAALYLDGSSPWGPVHKAPSVIFILILFTFLLFVREFFKSDKGLSFLRIISTLAGVIVCSLLMGHLLLIRDLRLVDGEGFKFIGRQMTFFMIFVIWSVDVGAWGAGRLFGKSPLSPVISPKKTWEGALGGTLLACAVAWLFREAFLKTDIGRVESIIYALLIAVTAQVSDLVESLMKRSFGVKNSSEILPGHGGILDRFDSFIFAAPFFYYLLVGTGRFQ